MKVIPSGVKLEKYSKCGESPLTILKCNISINSEQNLKYFKVYLPKQ